MIPAAGADPWPPLPAIAQTAANEAVIANDVAYHCRMMGLPVYS
jgi:hypothetical protein